MKHLDLFSGIGGFSLACEWAGIETIGFVEIDKYCQKVLKKHWPSVQIVEDIRNVEKIKEIVANATGEGCGAKRYKVGISEQALQETPARQSRRADSISGIGERTDTATLESPAILVTAGFPCQPFSVAGKRGGEKDDRYLWPETIAVIKAIKPTWVLLENVTGIINLALDTVLSDLEGAGYSYETLIIPACAVNAWHRRDRVWIVGYSTSDGQPNPETREGAEPRNQRGTEGKDKVCQSQGASSLWSKDVAESKSRESRQQAEQEGGQGSGRGSQEDVAESRLLRQTERELQATRIAQCDWWAVEPELGGMVDGISPFVDGYFDTEPDIRRVTKGGKNRVDRLKCLGNAIVPQVAYEIIKVIKEINDGL